MKAELGKGGGGEAPQIAPSGGAGEGAQPSESGQA